MTECPYCRGEGYILKKKDGYSIGNCVTYSGYYKRIPCEPCGGTGKSGDEK